MVALPIGSRRLDLVLLQHLATIVALELERLISEQERRRRVGTELFLRLRVGAMEHRAARSELTALGVPTGELVVMASSNIARGADLHFHLAAHGVGHLLAEDDDAVYVLIADDPETLVAAEAELRCDHLGISAPFAYLPEASQAFRQARWALQSAQREATHVVRYTDETAFPPFYPQDVRDAQRAVINILGPLMQYDDAHQSHLVETLHLFLTNNRSWQPTATALHIHKQTLVYRIRRIEQVTGRRLSSTADVAQLWLALEADGLLRQGG
jgi:purine catabolism regulator